jgi:hypothetical protein
MDLIGIEVEGAASPLRELLEIGIEHEFQATFMDGALFRAA